MSAIQQKKRLAVPEQIKGQLDEVQMWAIWIDDVEWHAILSRDELGVADPRWHISVAGEKEIPPWPVLPAIAHDLRPGVPFALGIPPRSWWINIHEFTLHMWELKDANLIAQWRAERMGHTPS